MTSYSLLQRACQAEPAAWERLCALYGPIVYSWCRRAGLQDSDAADTVQEVFRAVYQHLAEFQRQGGVFHAWLSAITANQVRLYFRQRQRRPAQFLGDDADDVTDPQLPTTWLDADTDSQLLRRHLVQRALELVRGDFSEATWQCFARTTLQNQSCVEVAAALGMSANAVRQARFRVLRRLRQELDGLV
ncbi:MAG TPA: sigma-70 family RNA polymerase sigma factor [Gemmataceae bacterium]|nr:sigma-70 family RNA polymerase sigma factor [Gemmataceae bacterium]